MNEFCRRTFVLWSKVSCLQISCWIFSWISLTAAAKTSAKSPLYSPAICRKNEFIVGSTEEQDHRSQFKQNYTDMSFIVIIS